MSSVGEVRVGIVGAGYVSAYHLRALRTLPWVRIVGIADPAAERAQALARTFGVDAVFGSLREMREAGPGVVHVLTPPAFHCDVALEAIAMGCDVFVEKPMAPTEAECERMIDAARRAGRVLSVNHSAKADPVVERGLALVARGAVGDVLSVDFCRSSDYPLYAGGPLPPAFRRGGYPFEDIGIHAVYLMEAFLGTIRNVDVQYRSTGRDPHVFFDDWRGTVECAKGVGQFSLSWSARPMRNELYVYGTKGYLHIDCFLQTCTLHKALPGPKAITGPIDATLTAARTLWTVPLNMARFAAGKLRPSPGIHAGVVQFHRALANGAEPPVSMDEGRRMVAWVEAASRRADLERDALLRTADVPRPCRVLVTGAAGLLGRALVDRLRAQGEALRVLVRRPHPALEADPGIDVVCGDLGDPDAVDRAVAGVDLVYHVGATMRGRGWPDFEAGTVRGTQNVVDACLRHGVSRLVYVSSMTVLDYASHRSGAVVTEDAPLEPYPDRRGAYTQSKLQAERIVAEAVRARGLPAVIVRPGMIFGPGAEGIPPYGTIAVAGRWIVVGAGRLRLPLVYVDDVVSALVSAASVPGIEGRLYHLVDPAPVTQNEYVAMCEAVNRGSLKISHVGRPVLYAAAATLAPLGRLLRRSLPLTRYRIASINELRFDCSRAQQDLSWAPTVGVESGLERAFGRVELRPVATVS